MSADVLNAPFYVLLGPDYAGKSSVLSALAAAAPQWRYISVDDEFLRPEHTLLADLRRGFVREALPRLGTTYSVDFVLSLLQTAVLYVRDQILASPERPALVDSYYYKILAKCRLIRGADHPLFSWWRTFPRPRRVVYLDVAPRTAWCRAAHRVNRLEHYGQRPDWPGFEAFQTDLGKVMRDEIRDVPVTVLGERGLSRTVREVRKVLADECG
jgi:thymidylate kinase